MKAMLSRQKCSLPLLSPPPLSFPFSALWYLVSFVRGDIVRNVSLYSRFKAIMSRFDYLFSFSFLAIPRRRPGKSLRLARFRTVSNRIILLPRDRIISAGSGTANKRFVDAGQISQSAIFSPVSANPTLRFADLCVGRLSWPEFTRRIYAFVDNQWSVLKRGRTPPLGDKRERNLRLVARDRTSMRFDFQFAGQCSNVAKSPTSSATVLPLTTCAGNWWRTITSDQAVIV